MMKNLNRSGTSFDWLDSVCSSCVAILSSRWREEDIWWLMSAPKSLRRLMNEH